VLKPTGLYVGEAVMQLQRYFPSTYAHTNSVLYRAWNSAARVQGVASPRTTQGAVAMARRKFWLGGPQCIWPHQ